MGRRSSHRAELTPSRVEQAIADVIVRVRSVRRVGGSQGFQRRKDPFGIARDGAIAADEIAVDVGQAAGPAMEDTAAPQIEEEGPAAEEGSWYAPKSGGTNRRSAPRSWRLPPT